MLGTSGSRRRRRASTCGEVEAGWEGSRSRPPLPPRPPLFRRPIAAAAALRWSLAVCLSLGHLTEAWVPAAPSLLGGRGVRSSPGVKQRWIGGGGSSRWCYSGSSRTLQGSCGGQTRGDSRTGRNGFGDRGSRRRSSLFDSSSHREPRNAVSPPSPPAAEREVGAAAGGGGGRGGGGDDSDALVKNAEKMLEGLKVPQLKELYRKAGGRPGSLRKSELVDSLASIMAAKQVQAWAAKREDTAADLPPQQEKKTEEESKDKAPPDLSPRLQQQRFQKGDRRHDTRGHQQQQQQQQRPGPGMGYQTVGRQRRLQQQHHQQQRQLYPSGPHQSQNQRPPQNQQQQHRQQNQNQYQYQYQYQQQQQQQQHGGRQQHQRRPPRRLPPIPNEWAVGEFRGYPQWQEESWACQASVNATKFHLEGMGSLQRRTSNNYRDMPENNLDVVFLGTASCVPSVTRGTQAICLRRKGEVWMFDAGEGTQIQLQRSCIRATRINKIFITHAHGDHSFGLPGLMCLLGQDRARIRKEPLEIYGPKGTRDYLRAALRYTYARITPPYVVHELHDIAFLHGDYSRPPLDYKIHLEVDAMYGERAGGRDIYPDERGVYHVFGDEEVDVYAGPMKHTVPCVGFVVHEKPKQGTLRAELLQPFVDEFRDAIVKEKGYRNPKMIFQDIKRLKPGETFTFPGDDRVWEYDEVVSPSEDGRKVVLMGDTCDASSLLELAQNADILVHEATNALIQPFDNGKDYGTVEHEAVMHGHSTPQMAGRFAKRINARQLVLSHFSPRYRGDDSPESLAVMRRIEEQARAVAGLQPYEVIAAWDMMKLSVLPKEAYEEWSVEAQRAIEQEDKDTAEVVAASRTQFEEWLSARDGGHALSQEEALEEELAKTRGEGGGEEGKEEDDFTYEF